jgi:hypothetical protein
LPDVEGDKPAKKKFKSYPIGFFHIDIAEVQTAQGKLYLFVAIDRTSTSDGLALAKAARTADPTIKIVYTCGAFNKLPEREKVTGAPCLRTPYHPHQLVGVIGQISNRPSFSGNELHAV